MRKTLFAAAVMAASLLCSYGSYACTNIIVTRGASTDGSNMVSYAADSHVLYGELYFQSAGRHRAGSEREIIDWDTAVRRGSIAQVGYTYQTVGNMNEKQLTIAETTWGGRMELIEPDGIMDYGSLIYVTLQRASTAREAIQTIVDLAAEYGYPSEGETFSIADKEEAWIMDLIGKGEGNKGIVWVARRIPDGYICAHANQPRITRFPLNDPNTLYSSDVISFAREKGYFSGPDSEFSFRDAYCPLDFGTVRGCDARVWSAFNILCNGTFTWEENGVEVSRGASEYLNYAMGYDLAGEMPLWVKPSEPVGVKDVADVMRDHYEGTPMDMRADIGAGGNACPYRWRPMEFEVDGKTYINERAIATQQTGFWFVAQSRPALPDLIGALLWFGTDDAATSYLTPIYVNTRQVPECFRVGNGNLFKYSETSSFWMNNRISNSCYRMYNQMEPVVRAAIDKFENEQMHRAVPHFDSLSVKLYGKHRKGILGKFAEWRVRRSLTEYTVNTAKKQFSEWAKLEKALLVKFIDGNVKEKDEEGNVKLSQPGYTQKWKEAVVKDHGPVIQVR